MPDLFFEAEKDRKNRWGPATGYVEDVFRTYSKNVPKRDPQAFQRAYEHYSQEREQWRNDVAERDHLLGELNSAQQYVNQLATAHNSLIEQFSRLKTEHERSTNGSSSTRGDVGLPSNPAPDSVVSGKESGEVQPETLRAGGADIHRQADKHADEGRQGDSEDNPANLPTAEKAVPEGGGPESRGESGGT